MVKKELIENVVVGWRKNTISLIRGWSTLVAKKEHHGIRKVNMASLFFIEAITTDKDNNRMRKKKGTSNRKHMSLTKER